MKVQLLLVIIIQVQAIIGQAILAMDDDTENVYKTDDSFVNNNSEKMAQLIKNVGNLLIKMSEIETKIARVVQDVEHLKTSSHQNETKLDDMINEINTLKKSDQSILRMIVKRL